MDGFSSLENNSRTISEPDFAELFVTQSFDWMQSRGQLGRPEAEADTDKCGGTAGEKDGAKRNGQGPTGDFSEEKDAESAKGDAAKSADQAERDRLDQKLQHDVEMPRADRFAQADFGSAFRDRNQHDIHDADAADD
jgi:hypothetical protein